MDRRRGAAARVFEDFDPAVEWKLAGEEQDVVEISLPGFCKDQVRVQVDNHGVLRATGERPARGGRWARFKKDLRLPDNCDADGVRARFEGEKLIITLPIVAATPSHSPTPSASRHGTPAGAAPEPKPSTPPLWQTPVSASPAPAPLPPRGAEEPPKNEKQLQDTDTLVREGDGRPPPPPEKKRRSKETKRAEPGGGARGKVNGGAVRDEKQPEKNNQARAWPPVGDAPTTTATMAQEPARQLVVNAAAAVAVLVGVIVAVWRTLQS